MIHLLRTQYGAWPLALELRHIQSVLTVSQARSINVLRPSNWLGDPEPDGHIALITQPTGPPIGVEIGHVLRFDDISQDQLHLIPPWLHQHMPPFFLGACLVHPHITWLMNIHHLITMMRDRTSASHI